MVLELGFLRFFEGEKLMAGEEIAMIFGASVNLDTAGNRVVLDINHDGLAVGTVKFMPGGVVVFGGDGVKI